ncbi:MAG: hypothetical protein ACFFCS_28450 [Candidatus Hodarchaeota archaeon]
MIKALIIFVDSQSAPEIHLAAIRLSTFDKILFFIDKSEKNDNLMFEMKSALDNLSFEYQEHPCLCFDYVESLISLSGYAKEFKGVYDKIYINASTGLLPGIIAFSQICWIYELRNELIFIRKSQSGTWYGKQHQIFYNIPLDSKYLKKKHLEFLQVFYRNYLKDKAMTYDFKKMVEFSLEISLIENVSVEEILNSPANRKRMHDFLKPLLNFNIIIKNGNTRSSMYKINIQN